MSEVLTFQDAILRLQEYWSGAGCMLAQPHNTEVGAGTMNPATFLRVLGPEPWNVGYVEPSVRPDDSRYGENPNRVQMHTQYQVILKPDPGNPQELYLASLEALGIDRSRHDIRFVEDNWESPALGAWGLGWEVWLDGLEITQFTYFQQAGGFTLDPVAVEITYGLERILMALQGVDHFKKIIYARSNGRDILYGEVFGQNEYEMSVYNLDEADPERVRKLFDLYEAEAIALLEKKLPVPAYQYVLKTSHAFNLLDARGAIGVTERARYFARMRDLARRVSKLWLERREEMEFPLGQPVPYIAPTPASAAEPPAAPATFLLEIGSEELPAEDVDSAIEQLRAKIPAMLADLRLAHGDVSVQGTPRRLAVLVRDVAPSQPDRQVEMRGPAAKVGFDAEGKPTKAAEGFARKAGIGVAQLQRRTVEGVDYVFAVVEEKGKTAMQALAEALPGLISSIAFTKTMRWNASNVAYSRPMRWIVALLGSEVVPFTYGGMHSDRTSRALRNSPRERFDIRSADEYLQAAKENNILLDAAERRERVWSGANELAREAGGSIPASAKGALLDEVTNLVESPTPLLGVFEEQYLELPSEVLVTVMRKHQRYFPVEDADGRLLPRFVAVANGEIDPATVRAGNEAVIRARYADAAFFWNHDIAAALSTFRPKLSGLTFQAKLGSMLDKSNRLELVVPAFCEWLDMSEEDTQTARRAANLCKADLVTQMVIELTSLAGIMGRHYALRSGETAEVAQAIFEHTLPRYAGDDLPTTRPAIALALADRIDSLVGLFAVGLAPKATADPFALRRAALGIVQTLVEREVRLDLRKAIHASAQTQPVPVTLEVEKDVLDFIQRRMEQWLLDQNARHDLVAAILAARGHDPAAAARCLKELAVEADTGRFGKSLTAYSRPARIVRGQQVASEVNPELFETEEERDLWQATKAVAANINADAGVGEFLDSFEPLCEPIDRFFDRVFVMVEDEKVRQNRLALLQCISALPDGIVDLTQVQGF